MYKQTDRSLGNVTMIFESEWVLSRYVGVPDQKASRSKVSGTTKEEISICWQIVYFIIYEQMIYHEIRTIVFLDDFRLFIFYLLCKIYNTNSITEHRSCLKYYSHPSRVYRNTNLWNKKDHRNPWNPTHPWNYVLDDKI